MHDFELHPRAVDVRDLQVRPLGQTQPGSVQSQQQHAMFGVWDTCDQPTDFLGAEHRRQPSGALAERDVLHDPGPGERNVIEEA